MAFSFPRLFLARWHLPRQSLDATSASALAGAAYARVDAGWKPARWVKIGLAGVAGTTFGRMKIRFAGNQAGTWGSVFLESLLVVGVEWE